MVLEKIDFILENCEVISIDGKYVNTFLVDDISHYFSRVGMNCIMKIKRANTFAIEIHKNADEDYCSFGLRDFKQKKFKRLIDYPDITQIRFILDGEEYLYYLDWNDEASSCYNSYQSCYLTDEGHLYISVAKDKTIYDFFPQDYLLDNEAINDSFSLCDIEDNKTE